MEVVIGFDEDTVRDWSPDQRFSRERAVADIASDNTRQESEDSRSWRLRGDPFRPGDRGGAVVFVAVALVVGSNYWNLEQQGDRQGCQRRECEFADCLHRNSLSL